MLAPGVDPGAAEGVGFSCYEEETSFGLALFDVRNCFNELNRYLMLWNMAHRRNQGSRFAFHRYRHWDWVHCLVVWTEPGELPLVIQSRGGASKPGETCTTKR